jgi:hypothetical protein
MLFVATIAIRLLALVGISLAMLALSLVLHTVALRRLLLAQPTPLSHQPGIVK